MLTCPNPVCKKRLNRLNKVCPHCRTDLSLLVEYVDELHGGLDRAEALTRAGKLGEAVWAYLEVLEVDPENATAREQVGQVVTAVRQFDRAAPGQRWLQRLRRHARFRRRIRFWEAGIEENRPWIAVAAILLLAATMMLAGYFWGYSEGQPRPATTGPEKPEKGQQPGPGSRPMKDLPAGKSKERDQPAGKSKL